MNRRHTLKSGRVLLLQLSSFAVSARLRKVVAAELKHVSIGEVTKVAAGLTPEELLAKGDLPLDTLKSLVCQFLASDAVEDALWECMKVCQYGPQGQTEKITPESFEPEDAREDYLPVAWEVMVLNLAPFFKSLDLSSLTAGARQAGSSPPSG